MAREMGTLFSLITWHESCYLLANSEFKPCFLKGPCERMSGKFNSPDQALQIQSKHQVGVSGCPPLPPGQALGDSTLYPTFAELSFLLIFHHCPEL